MMTAYTIYATVELNEAPSSETLIDVVQHALEHETNGIARHITVTTRGGNQPIAVRIRPTQRDHSPCWNGS